MNGSANVHSLEAIEAVRGALRAYGDQIEQSLTMIDIEMRRVLDWLEHDRPRYWRTQVRVARDGLTEARAALHRCLMYPIADERPSCHEERAAVKRAQARLAYCEEKAERLQHWMREVQHEMFEYEGRIGQLKAVVECEVPQSIGILDRLRARLEEYQAIRTAGGAKALATGNSLVGELWPESKNYGSDQAADESRESTMPTADPTADPNS